MKLQLNRAEVDQILRGTMSQLSSIEILGAGPAGLYTAILIRKLLPHVRVRVTEQNPEGATFGFGVVFSDQALEFLNADDPETHDLITPLMERWKNMTLNLPNGSVTLDGVGFTAIGRLELIEILKERALALGVPIRFDTEITSLEELKADLVIGADGLNSLVRRSLEAEFKPKIEYFDNHFAWFGAKIPFETLTQTFIQTDKGPLNAHHYRFSADRSTFIVECDDPTYKSFGFDNMDEDQSARVCSDLFKDVLNGSDLITNKSMWRQFPRLWCENWVAGRHVLLGDAVHTAHFSIGSGTRLALEDAIALVRALADYDDVDQALASYQRLRQPVARKIVDAANTSATWYETFGEKMLLAPMDFAHDYLMRSGRMTEERLRKVAPDFAAQYHAQKANPALIVDPVSNDAPGAIEIGFDKKLHHNCSELLWQNLSRNPDKTALIGPAGAVSYRTLVDDAARWGNAFIAAGLKRGDRIAFYLDDSPTFVASFYGAVRAGFVPVLLNIQTKPDVLNYFLKDSGAELAVVEGDLIDAFTDAATVGSNLRSIVLANSETETKGCVTAKAFLAGHETTLECANTTSEEMAFWMYSSGTTGRPKGIVHLHHDMAYVQASFGENILRLNADDICYSVPKSYFAYGFGNSLIFPLAIGATVLLMPGQPRPDVVLKAIETHRPTVLFGLPTLYTALARSEDVVTRDLSSLRQSMSAAEILSEDIYNAWKQKVGHGPTEGLGSTEMLHIYLSNTIGDHRPGAAGARVPGFEIRLETPDGTAAASGEEGVMSVRGQSSAPCYWNRPDKTSDTMRDDWIYTGDRFVERDGYYYFQGRADDLIKISGQWVWPLEVERCLNEHPDIHECAVFAHQLDDKRMALRAVVSLVPGVASDEAQTHKLRDHVKSVLTPYKAPRLFEYVAELPKTGTGKIDRHALI
jgi:benzoate-CoA ligase family protein